MAKNVRERSQLCPFSTEDSSTVHLALRQGTRTLCGLTADKAVDLTAFIERGCSACVDVARAAGTNVVHGSGAAVNLERLSIAHPPPTTAT
jgi:hypothetical protein